MNAIILVGGLGTRLRPLTLHRPKALLPIINQPFLKYQFEILRKGGVREIILATAKSAKPWIESMRQLRPKGVRVHLACEPYPLGTGGAIRYAFDQLKKMALVSPVHIVFNGDVLFELNIIDFLHFHQQNQSQGTIALTKVKDPSQFGVVTTDIHGQIKKFIEKPKTVIESNEINAGAYILESSLLEMLPPNRTISIEKDIFPQFLKKNVRLFGYKMNGYWNDIGTPQTYLKAHADLLKRSRTMHLFGSGCHIYHPVSFKGFVCCGKGVKIYEGCEIEDSVIMEGTTLGKETKMVSSILGRGCKLEDHVELGRGTILGDETFLSSYTRC